MTTPLCNTTIVQKPCGDYLECCSSGHGSHSPFYDFPPLCYCAVLSLVGRQTQQTMALPLAYA